MLMLAVESMLMLSVVEVHEHGVATCEPIALVCELCASPPSPCLHSLEISQICGAAGDLGD